MDLQTSLLSCLCGTNDNPNNNNNSNYPSKPITEKPAIEPLPSTTAEPPVPPTDDELAAQILTLLLTAPTPAPGTDLTPLITTTTNLSTASWTSRLAERLLHALEATLKGDHATWGEAVTDAYLHAEELAREELTALWEYAQEHPVEVAAEVVLTVLALGVLVRLVPAFVRILGFGRLGPVEGEFVGSERVLFGFECLADRYNRVICGVVAAGVWRVCAEGIALVVFAADGDDVGVRRQCLVVFKDEVGTQTKEGGATAKPLVDGRNCSIQLTQAPLKPMSRDNPLVSLSLHSFYVAVTRIQQVYTPPIQPRALSKLRLSVSGGSNPFMVGNLSGSERARNGIPVAHSRVVRELQAVPARSRKRAGGPAGRVGDVDRQSVAACLVGNTHAVELGANSVHAEMRVSFRSKTWKNWGRTGRTRGGRP